MTAAYRLSNVVRSHGPRRVLDIDSAEFAAGAITAVVGPNGCGKTTLLECLAALSRPDSGGIRYNGRPLDASARGKVTMVFQQPFMFSGTVAYNVGFGPRVRGAADPSAVDSALRAVRLDGFGNRAAKRLSGGETKRVAIARALALKPETLLLDEPTANIDAENTAIIEETVLSLSRERGTTIIMATHDRDQAARLADSILLLRGGRLAPFFPDNCFTAFLTAGGEIKTLEIPGVVSTEITTARPPGEILVTLPPESVDVSAHPVSSPGVACISGVVTAVSASEGGVRVTCAAGAPLTALMPTEKHKKLRPAVGDTVHLAFDEKSIRII